MSILSNFGIKDIIDILLVAALMYQGYRMLKKSGSAALFNGVLAFFVIWIVVSQVLHMNLLGAIMDKFFSVGIIAIIILFQDEIKRFLMTLGNHRMLKWMKGMFSKSKMDAENDKNITQIVQACASMAKGKVGALIVIEQNVLLSRYETLGQTINAEISARLIETIFFKNSPLHDGAMIISGEKIIAAGTILPVSFSADIPTHLGLRHRAALGMSKETDAKIIVISEERGSISFVRNSNLELNISPQRLQELLMTTDSIE